MEHYRSNGNRNIKCALVKRIVFQVDFTLQVGRALLKKKCTRAKPNPLSKCLPQRNAIYTRNINLIYLNMERGLIILYLFAFQVPRSQLLTGRLSLKGCWVYSHGLFDSPQKYYREIVRFFFGLS